MISLKLSLGLTINENKYGYFDLGTWDGEDYCESDEGISDVNRDAVPIKELVPPNRVGCRASGCEEDDGDNDCGTAYSHEGVIVYGINVENIFDSNFYSAPDWDGSWSEEDAAGVVRTANYRSSDGNAYLCASGSYWYGCTPDLIGTITWVPKNEKEVLYQCTYHDPTTKDYTWWEELPGTDFDHDGITTNNGDCDDNPSGEPSVCADLTPNQCGLSTSECAICINPDAIETCGDTADNDCNPDTSDNCDHFQAGCEQSSLKKDTDPDETPGKEQRNIHNQYYSWVKTGENEGYCCGYHGLEQDLGKDLTGADGSHYLCLNKAKSLVGRSVEDIPGWNTEKCSGEWCWINAIGENIEFQILTIKKPAGQPYDIVSNSQNWIQCEENLGSISTNLADPEKIKNANRFRCY